MYLDQLGQPLPFFLYMKPNLRKMWGQHVKKYELQGNHFGLRNKQYINHVRPSDSFTRPKRWLAMFG